MIKLLLQVLLLFTASNIYALDMLDGSYSLKATVQETNNNNKYPFTINLSIKNNNITGNIDYINDNCSGIIKGKILSNTELELFENITKGADLCDNVSSFTTLYHFKSNILKHIG